ncbi:MAG: hypothetical protein GX817_01335 [Elusimicrobia bacterium]|nr:hypothetical protein [Elusimicrobiota bacterium]
MKSILRLIFIIPIFAFLPACQQTGLYDYSSPEATYETYLEQSKTLSVVADPRHYRRVIRCFSKKDWKWFETNFERIPADREEGVYESLSKTKRMAYVFGRGIVPYGPPLDEENFSFESSSKENGSNPSDHVVLSVEGYPQKINFSKESRGWVICGLFGVRDSLEE